MNHFQLLPSNIVLAIAKGATLHHFSLNDKTDGLNDEDIKRLLILSSLCRGWRDVALSLLCRKYTISDNCRTRPPFRLFNSRVYCEYTRVLELHLNGQQILGGCAAYGQYSPLFQKDLYFPNANEICVDIDSTEKSSIFYSIGGMSALVQRIKCMAPRARKIQISHSGNIATDNERYWTGINLFTKCLCSSDLMLQLSLGSNFRAFDNGLSALATLTCLDFEWNIHVKEILGILYSCSDKLQELTIHKIDAAELSQLVVKEDGTPVVYPYLLNLILDGESDEVPSNRPVFDSIAPFPRLSELRVSSVYPFGDDILFRENNKSLKELCLSLDQQAINILNRARIFACGRYTQLTTVEIKSFIADINNSEYQAKQHMCLLQNIAPTLRNLIIHDIDIAQEFINTMPKTTLFKDIRTLTLCDIHLLLSDVFKILKALPALQQLTSGLASVDLSTNSHVWENLQQVCKKYHHSLGQLFAKWVISHSSIICVSTSALYAVVLASACPRFQAVELPECHINEYRDLVDKYMECQSFTKKSDTPVQVLSKPISV